MLYIHTSNQLEQLKNQYALLVEKPLSNPFDTETVIVQNAGMARWLSMQLADTCGVSANTEFLFPAEFMWYLLRLVSPDIPEKNQCTPDTVRFHIMRELSQNPDDYPELQHYIGATSENQYLINEGIAIWDLSCELSQLFDQYLFYRSHWIKQWESPEWNSDKHWQSRLWNRCIKDRGLTHWLALQDQFKVSFSSLDQDKLKQRISFFSMSALSPGYIDMLGELGKKTDVHLFLINPCQDVYWGDIQSEKAIAKMDQDTQSYMDLNNPILSSMGKQGRDFIDRLINLPSYEEVNDFIGDIHFDSSEKAHASQGSILSLLQRDIQQLANPEAIAHLTDASLDESISIHACHTAMREVEVLHDQILHELDSNSDLAPSDIVVMMPDVEKYAPYIDAVFSASKPTIPFSISDREALNVFQIIEAITKLFNLPDTHFDVESVFELLNYSDISDKFDLDSTQIKRCRDLAKATNIRWGISAASRKKDQLPNTEEHTWKYALDRMLLGYSLGEAPHELLPEEKLFQSERLLTLLAYNDIEGSEAQLLSNLKQFTDCIFSISEWHSMHLNLSEWIEKTSLLIKKITTESTDQQRLINSLSELNALASFTEFDQAISYSIFYKMLMSKLQSIAANEKYLGYGITFCALVPMRSMPFKVVALIGMNDGEFPRQDTHKSFDLMADKPLKGDRSRRDEDRYLFLESLLAARNKLIISYNGLSVKDNSDIPPSVLVNELLETLSVYTSCNPEELIIKHPLQAFSPKYFISDPVENDTNHILFSYAHEYCSLYNNANKTESQNSQCFITEPLEEPDASYRNISLIDFISFYSNPSRFFLKHRFSIQTFDDDPSLKIREPFELEAFKNRDIRNLIVEDLKVDESPAQAMEADNKNAACQMNHAQVVARATGLLPYGQIGDEIYAKEKHITDHFIATLPEQSYALRQNSTHYFNLEIGRFSLHGKLDQLIDNGRSLALLTPPYAGDFIGFWLTHLVLNAVEDLDSEKMSFILSPETDLQLNPVIDAKSRLLELLEYYWKGMSFPLKFFPKSAFAMHQNYPRINPGGAQDKWLGNDRFQGEKDSFEHWLLHRTMSMDKNHLPQEFIDISQKIFGDMYQQQIQS